MTQLYNDSPTTLLKGHVSPFFQLPLPSETDIKPTLYHALGESYFYVVYIGTK
jgi:hypothetical protein